jgi:hypothetical protein
VNANRSRSAPAYPLPHGGGTAMPGRRPGTAGARDSSCAVAFLGGRPPDPRGTTGTHSRPVALMPHTDP